ncbi:hypothetical protein [Azohydromonas lata]|uniref:hypothetical protein n=1 Tax=Azohydromonas lata TaxID=45677 RepID=UPI000ABD631A|nr:hypothetical protein [Azohydromonas lata]
MPINMHLTDVIPWGRSLAEYQAMFSLSQEDLNKKRILGCGDGPASFNAEATAQGGRVISADPIYAFSRQQIESRILESYSTIMAQLASHQADYIWDLMQSVENVGRQRMQAMNRFLADYDIGKHQERYVEAALPTLPFESKIFDLALCSHFLFLYSSQVALKAHIEGAREMCRVAAEVRIYPLVAMKGGLSPHLPAVMDALQAEGIQTNLAPVSYRFQKGATQMLVLRRQ